ncbi:MAG: hypothetical protein LBC82_06115 [Oscillospiraceae bacterium]|nr:hypothetical protein [Oscillospiraceae bacterium]
MINEFSSEVINEVGFYVYRLIDPRNGNTFISTKEKCWLKAHKKRKIRLPN